MPDEIEGVVGASSEVADDSQQVSGGQGNDWTQDPAFRQWQSEHDQLIAQNSLLQTQMQIILQNAGDPDQVQQALAEARQAATNQELQRLRQKDAAQKQRNDDVTWWLNRCREAKANPRDPAFVLALQANPLNPTVLMQAIVAQGQGNQSQIVQRQEQMRGKVASGQFQTPPEGKATPVALAQMADDYKREKNLITGDADLLVQLHRKYPNYRQLEEIIRGK